MTEMQDPNEIYRQSLAKIPRPTEAGPPTIKRAEVWPYPAAFPNLAFSLYDAEGAVVATMFQVEIRDAYQSLTMHLRHPPQPGRPYRLEIELSRDEQVLDTRLVDFDLTFRDPADGAQGPQQTGRHGEQPAGQGSEGEAP
jgi:hypothetical protein